MLETWKDVVAKRQRKPESLWRPLHTLCHKRLMNEEGRTLVRTNISHLGVIVFVSRFIPPILTLLFITGCNYGDVGRGQWQCEN